MNWNIYLAIIFVFGLIFFGSAIYALVWASKKGQLRDFEKGSRVIFDEDEPEGEFQDNFPKSNKRVPNTEKRRNIKPEKEGTLL